MSAEYPMLYLAPVGDALVRMPEHSMAPRPAEGQWVPDNAYYQIHLRDGAVVEVNPK